MKKMHFVLFFVVGFAFLFFSCDVTEKPNSTIPELVEIAKSNDQGEDNDDQGRKQKPPIVKPLVKDEENPPVSDPPKNDFTEVDNLLDKYGISIMRSDWFIWNDYMPGWGWELTPEGERASICTIPFSSENELPLMEVSAKIITGEKTLEVSFYDLYGDEYGKPFFVDFRPVNCFRIDGEYTIEITVYILGEKQTITFENLRVYATH